jgi:hypothetical protein
MADLDQQSFLELGSKKENIAFSFLFSKLQKLYSNSKKTKIQIKKEKLNLISKFDKSILDLSDMLTDFEHSKSRFQFKSLFEELKKNEGICKETTNLNLSSNNLEDASNLSFFVSEVLPLFENCNVIDLSFNRYKNDIWIYLKKILENTKIVYVNICGNPLASITSKTELSSDISIHKKLIWIFLHWITPGNWKYCLDQSVSNFNELEQQIIETHKKFYENN